MTNLDSILKNRDITLPIYVHLVKAMVSPVVVYGCESQTIKKAECQRIDAFELWCWIRLLRVPWRLSRRSNQSILKEINPEYSWKDWCWSSNTLATWLEELTHLKRPWCWERFRHDWATEQWTALSLKDGEWGCSCWEIQAANHGFMFLVTHSHSGASQMPT